MEIYYKNSQIRKICTNPEKHLKGSTKLIEELESLLTIISTVDNLAYFDLPPNKKRYNPEYLQGQKKNQDNLLSLRIHEQFRLIFRNVSSSHRVQFVEIQEIIIEEVSNHYAKR